MSYSCLDNNDKHILENINLCLKTENTHIMNEDIGVQLLNNFLNAFDKFRGTATVGATVGYFYTLQISGQLNIDLYINESQLNGNNTPLEIFTFLFSFYTIVIENTMQYLRSSGLNNIVLYENIKILYNYIVTQYDPIIDKIKGVYSNVNDPFNLTDSVFIWTPITISYVYKNIYYNTLTDVQKINLTNEITKKFTSKYTTSAYLSQSSNNETLVTLYCDDSCSSETDDTIRSKAVDAAENAGFPNSIVDEISDPIEKDMFFRGPKELDAENDYNNPESDPNLLPKVVQIGNPLPSLAISYVYDNIDYDILTDTQKNNLTTQIINAFDSIYPNASPELSSFGSVSLLVVLNCEFGCAVPQPSNSIISAKAVEAATNAGFSNSIVSHISPPVIAPVITLDKPTTVKFGDTVLWGWAALVKSKKFVLDCKIALNNLINYFESGNIPDQIITSSLSVGTFEGNRVWFIERDGVTTPQPSLNLIQGITYRFSQENNTNVENPFRFSLEDPLTNQFPTQYSVGVNVVGNPGFPGSYVEITPAENIPQIIYYYNTNVNAFSSGENGMTNSIDILY